MTYRTSQSHPIRIDTVDLPNGGRLGLSLCPGKKQAVSMTGGWDRDLPTDLDAVKAWGAQAVVSILEKQELKDLQVTVLGSESNKRGMHWVNLDLPNDAVPTRAFMEQWKREKSSVHQILDKGGDVFVHCMGGIGRTSTLAAMIMMERGSTAEQAIGAISDARPDSFSVPEQVEFLKSYHPPIHDKSGQKSR